MLEDSRAERLQELGALMQDLDVRILVVDQNLRVLSANRAALRYAPPQLVGASALEIFAPEHSQLARRCLEKVLTSGENQIFESGTATQDAPSTPLEYHLGPIREDGEVVAVLMAGVDISLRKKAQLALKESERKSHDLIDRTPISIWHEDCTDLGHHLDELRSQGVRDLREYLEQNPQAATTMAGMVRVRSVNAATLKMYGAESMAQLLGSLHKLFDEHSYEVFTQEVITIWEGRTFFEAETQNKALDGRTVHILIRMLIDQQDGHLDLANVVVTMVDITDRKQADQERRALEARMRDTQKLESLGVLAGGIAHDFNNLLVGMLGNANMIGNELESSSPLLPQIQAIEQSANRAADLCRQMLAYSGRGQFQLEAVGLNDLVSEMINLLQASISKRVQIHLDFALELPAVEADATQLRQVIMNLIVNASEALEERGGEVSLTTEHVQTGPGELSDTFLDDQLPAGSYVCLTVQDNGPGMDEETRARVFEPFYTTKFTGRGLGLAAVLGIVRGHHGAIRVDSEPGRGTRFRVWLPTSSERAVEPATAATANGSWQGSGTCLVVDDDPTVREVAANMLERLGFDVLLATDGQEAIQQVLDHRAELTCVLLDLSMPRMGGAEAFGRIRQLSPEVTVIFSSGFNQSDITEQLSGEHATGFVQKPYSLQTFTRVLREVFGEQSERAGGSDQK